MPTTPNRTRSVAQWRDDKGSSTIETSMMWGAACVIGVTLAAVLIGVLIDPSKQQAVVQMWQAIPSWVLWAVVAVAAVELLRRVLRRVRPPLWLTDDNVLHIRRGKVTIALDQVRGVVHGVDPPGFEYVYFLSVDPEFHRVQYDSRYRLDRQVSLSAGRDVAGDSPEWLGSIGFDTLRNAFGVRVQLDRYFADHHVPSNIDLVELRELVSHLPAWSDSLPVRHVG